MLCNSEDHSGLEVLSYYTLNNVFKINWYFLPILKKVKTVF